MIFQRECFFALQDNVAIMSGFSLKKAPFERRELSVLFLSGLLADQRQGDAERIIKHIEHRRVLLAIIVVCQRHFDSAERHRDVRENVLVGRDNRAVLIRDGDRTRVACGRVSSVEGEGVARRLFNRLDHVEFVDRSERECARSFVVDVCALGGNVRPFKQVDTRSIANRCIQTVYVVFRHVFVGEDGCRRNALYLTSR